MATKFGTRRALKTVSRVLAAALLIFLVITLWNQTRSWTPRPTTKDNASSSQRESCRTEQQHNVGIIVKTGASEVFDKLPAQLQTTLSCAESLLLMSDLDFEFEGHHFHDVLKNVNTDILDNSPAFEVYHSQRALKEQGYSLEQMKNTLNSSDPSHPAAWDLDKYKFLHMLNKVYTEMPDKDWYMFIEADTYLNWANFLAWLAQLDASQELYIGGPSFMGGTKFNHGGHGFLLSAPALRTFAGEHPEMAAAWDERMSQECCGDYVLALALNELGIPTSGVWPMLSGEPPLEVPFGPALWCQPIITLHHVGSADVRAMWEFEKSLDGAQRPMLFQDLYNHWLPDGLPDARTDWDNRCPGSVFDIRGFPEETTTSIDACAQACEGIPYCMQYLFREGECKLYKCFTLGKAAAPSDEKSWHSVWRVDRINDWIREHATCTTEWIPHSTDNARHGGV